LFLRQSIQLRALHLAKVLRRAADQVLYATSLVAATHTHVNLRRIAPLSGEFETKCGPWDDARGDGVEKIGYTANIGKRMAAYPPGVEQFAVEPGVPKGEKPRHRQFGARAA
jgi:hypothetical protein